MVFAKDVAGDIHWIILDLRMHDAKVFVDFTVGVADLLSTTRIGGRYDPQN